MKKILFTLFLTLFFITAFAQSKYHYVIKIDSISDAVSLRKANCWIDEMFGKHVYLNDSTGCFDFYSNLNVEKATLQQKTSDYIIIYFHKASILVVKPKSEETEK